MNTDLKALIEMHTYKALENLKLLHHEVKENSDENPNSDDLGLNEEQANLMISAIEMKEKTAKDLMIPIEETFMVSYDDAIDKFRLNLILERGYSRIPVYSGSQTNDIIGLLRIKQLLGVDLNNKSLRQLGIQLRSPLVISPKLSLLDLLREFRKGKSHMAFITEQVEELQNKLGLNRSNSIDIRKNKSQPFNSKITILGIIALEDVIEKMINVEIYDEDDYDEMIKDQYKITAKDKSIHYFFQPFYYQIRL